ncbi:hypothetical protein AAMO2058_000146900 [Amorphochlora amoebiformis]
MIRSAGLALMISAVSYTFVLVESTTRLRGPLSPRPFRPVGRQCRHISLSARSSRPPRQPRRGGGGRGDFPGGSSPMGSMEGGQGSGEEIMPPQAIPLKPKSTLGVALRESIEEDNSSFEWIQNEQIRWLSGQKEEINLLKYSRRLPAPGGKRGEVGPLIPKKKAMEEHRVRLADLGKMVIDLMYNMILFRFKTFGIEPVRAGELDGPFTDIGPVDLLALTSGIHTEEAVEMVRSHLISVLGPMMPKDNNGFYTQAAKLPKLQLSQVYMTSVMFGYFLRRVDRSYQGAKKFGMLDSTGDSTDRIEAMLRNSGDVQVPDPSSFEETIDDVFSFDDEPTSWSEEEEEFHHETEGGKEKRTISLKEYVERFDSKTLVQCASLMSQEAAILLQEYQYNLFGNIRDLQREMAMALGPMEEAQPSPDTIMRRISSAIQEDRVQTLVITFADQRRLVLEAVALGSFLRDSEDQIEKRADTDILTPLPPLPLDDSPIRGMLNPGSS